MLSLEVIVKTSQKTTIIGCIEVADGNKERAIQMYTNLDSAGLVARESNIKPLSSHDYAVIMYHTAKARNWV